MTTPPTAGTTETSALRDRLTAPLTAPLAVEHAFRTVPRHASASEAPVVSAYADDIVQCTEWRWWPPNALPEPTVGHARAALEAISPGTRYTAMGRTWHRPARCPLKAAVSREGPAVHRFATQDEWDRNYADGRRFSPLSDRERSLLATHTPPPAAGRALDIGCGVGELAAHLSTLGYAVDAVDWSETALAEAAAQHGTAVRWLRLDIESDDGTPLHADGYDLITLRFVVPILNSRARTLHALGRRLRPGGALVVVTPRAADTPAQRRRLALGEDELAELRTDWASTTLHDAGGLAFVILRDPCRTGTTTPQDSPRAAGTQGTPSRTGSVEHTAAASPRQHR
ncbi:methyltransferase domain-containing protein [Streptomyces sp. LN704]|uniref:methyltransferase domain-containing protein n=1 Tax=Streptomyces sp. LN704 TaxID=3112982 RepID=UPI003712CAA4